MSEKKYISYDRLQIEENLNTFAKKNNVGKDKLNAYINFFRHCEEVGYPMSKEFYDSLFQFQYSSKELDSFINLGVISSEKEFNFEMFQLYLALTSGKFKEVSGSKVIQSLKQAFDKDISYEEIARLCTNADSIAALNKLIRDYSNDKQAEIDDDDISETDVDIEKTNTGDDDGLKNTISEMVHDSINQSLNKISEDLKSSFNDINNKISNSSLEQKITFLESENKKLSEKNHTISNRALFYEEAKKDLFQKNMELKEELRQIKKEMRDLENQISSLKTLNESLERDNSSLSDANKKLENEVSEYKNELDEKSDELITKNEELDAKSVELEEKNEELEKLNEEFEYNVNSEPEVEESEAFDDPSEEDTLSDNNTLYRDSSYYNLSNNSYSNEFEDELDKEISDNMQYFIKADNDYIPVEQTSSKRENKANFFKKIVDSYIFARFKKMTTEDQKKQLWNMSTSINVYDKNDPRNAQRLLKIKKLMENGFDNVLIYQIIYQKYSDSQIDELLQLKKEDIEEANKNQSLISVSDNISEENSNNNPSDDIQTNYEANYEDNYDDYEEIANEGEVYDE